MTMRYSLVKLSGNPSGQVKSELGHVLVTIALLVGKLIVEIIRIINQFAAMVDGCDFYV
jgi:hypothetical protein